MSQSLLMSDNSVPVVDAQTEADAMRDRVEALEDEVSSLRSELRQLGRENYKTIARLLSPLYKALEPVFGEIRETMDAGSNNNAWDGIKQRLSPRHREAIDILLLQRTMNRKQMAAALKMGYNNCVNNIVGPLVRQGWIVDTGGSLTLKQL